MTEEKRHCDNQGCFCHGIGPQATAFAEHIWSQVTRDHFRNSRVEFLKGLRSSMMLRKPLRNSTREFLKGLRSIIDDRIDRLSRHAAPKGTSVPVD